MKRLAFGVFLGLSACSSAVAKDDLPVYRVSVPAIAQDSALIGTKLTVRSGRVYRLVDCPAGWSVTIVNDPD